MKTKIIVPAVILLAIAVLLNIHIIRLKGDIDIIAKDHMTFRETYIDARDMRFFQFFGLSERVRDYLVYEKKLPGYARYIRKEFEDSIESAKENLWLMENSLKEWMSEMKR